MIRCMVHAASALFMCCHALVLVVNSHAVLCAASRTLTAVVYFESLWNGSGHARVTFITGYADIRR